MAERVFYCPRHGRVTEAEYRSELGKGWWTVGGCDYCSQWFARLPRFKAKRGSET